MDQIESVAREHRDFTRRYFLHLSVIGVIAPSVSELCGQDRNGESYSMLNEAISKLEYLTREENFKNFGRGNPPPHKLTVEKRRKVGLLRETWHLEVLLDSESKAEVKRPLSKELGTALNWEGLMKIAESKAVRFMSVMSCTNSQIPCGMGLWEGVPLRDVVWLAHPISNIRRIFYYGYHNDDLKQRFQSSLPIGRVLEDPPGEHPIILCYKLNNQWLTSKRGGPVRMIVPEAYGNKSVKWLQRVILTNLPQANDTYAQWNNDTVSHIKTCARFIHIPKTIKAGRPVPITGVAQMGMSNLRKVQYWLCPHDQSLPKDDPYFTKAPWQDADILPPPDKWGGGLPKNKLPTVPLQFDTISGNVLQWPLSNTIVHWATLLTVKHSGQYDLRCRTIDANGVAQPMPRPFKKSGHNAIQRVTIVAEK